MIYFPVTPPSFDLKKKKKKHVILWVLRNPLLSLDSSAFQSLTIDLKAQLEAQSGAMMSLFQASSVSLFGPSPEVCALQKEVQWWS